MKGDPATVMDSGPGIEAHKSSRFRAAVFCAQKEIQNVHKEKDERNVVICPTIQVTKKAGARKERAACLFAFCFLAFLYKEEISGTVRGLQI